MNPQEIRADLAYLRNWYDLASGISIGVAEAGVFVPTQWLLSEAWDIADLDVANVALVGLFSRGKSTLFNRLVGHSVSPVSQFPETAMIVEAETGPARAWAETTDGERQEIEPSPDRFRATITREANGGFVRARICGSFRLPAGLRLTDTPGVGSVDAIGDDAWSDLHVDAALVVLSSPPGHSRTDVELLRDVERRFTGRIGVLLQAIDQSVSPESLRVLADQVQRNTGVRPLIVPDRAPNHGWSGDRAWADIEVAISNLAERAIADRYQKIADRIAKWCDAVAHRQRSPEEISRLQAAAQSTVGANSSILRIAVSDALRRAEWSRDELERREAAAHFERIQQDFRVLSQFRFVLLPNLQGESNATLDGIARQEVSTLSGYRWTADWYPELARIRGLITATNSPDVRAMLNAAVNQARRDRDARVAAERLRAVEDAARRLETWRTLRIVSFVLWAVAVVMLISGDSNAAGLSFFVWLGSFVLWLAANSSIRQLDPHR